MEIKNQRVFFLENPVYFSLMLIFNFGKFLLNNAYHVFNCTLTEKCSKPYPWSRIKLPKMMTKVFLFPPIINLFSQCSDIEANPGLTNPEMFIFNTLSLEFKRFHSSWFHQNLVFSSVYHTAQLWHNLSIRNFFG